jgi:hypothetical protein
MPQWPEDWLPRQRKASTRSPCSAYEVAGLIFTGCATERRKHPFA